MRVEVIDSEAGITSVVQNFGIIICRYFVSPVCFMLMILVPVKDMLRPVLLVIGLLCLKLEHDINHRFGFICSDDALQHTLRFFQLHRFNIYERKQQTRSIA